MSHDPVDADSDLDAGPFSAWLDEMQGAIGGDNDADVPCGTCTACCTASQFIDIAPEESDALAHIPSALLFPAPGAPRGHVLMGYDERGHCPMLVDGGCSIYEHRPRTCRTYDCRVFAAGDVVDDDVTKHQIAARASRWRFDLTSPTDRTALAAVRAAAGALDEHADELPDHVAPHTATQRAVLAVEIHDVFLERNDGDAAPTVIDPGPDAVLVAVELRRGRRG